MSRDVQQDGDIGADAQAFSSMEAEVMNFNTLDGTLSFNQIPIKIPHNSGSDQNSNTMQMTSKMADMMSGEVYLDNSYQILPLGTKPNTA